MELTAYAARHVDWLQPPPLRIYSGFRLKYNSCCIVPIREGETESWPPHRYPRSEPMSRIQREVLAELKWDARIQALCSRYSKPYTGTGDS